MNWNSFARIFEIISSRYFLIAAVPFLFFYLLQAGEKRFRKIQQKFPGSRDYLHEIGYSVVTIGIFTLVFLILLKSPVVAPHTTLYKKAGQYGWPYFILAFPLMFIMHDSYFYWTHRLMHHPRLFRIFHLVHHQSTNPSPWAAYAFHPLEALVEIGITVLFLFIMPIHAYHLMVFSW